MSKVFLGGTCNGSREKLIPMLKIAYFNPAMEDLAQKRTRPTRTGCAAA